MSRAFAIIAVLGACLCACNRIDLATYGKSPVMEVAGQVLYYEDIIEAMPKGLSGKDSANFVNHYKDRWAVNTILYEKASGNVGNIREINRRTEKFRRELIISEYKQQLVASKMHEVEADSIVAFYEKHKAEFPLSDAVLKGVFLKIPASAPDQNELKRWLEDLSDENLDNIMRYCTQNAIVCEFFNDNWIPFSKISGLLLEKLDSNDPKLGRGTVIQTSGNENCYLRVSGIITAGNPMPLEMASSEIQTILENKQKVDIIRQFENGLYNEAVEEGKIKNFSENR